MLPPILFEGSVKNVRGIKGKAPYVFEYTDRYSVFDWGAMPDLLENKGKSLAFIGNLFFHLLGDPDRWRAWKAPAIFERNKLLEKLRSEGANHHCLGLIDEEIKPLSFNQLSNVIAVTPVEVREPDYIVQGGELRWDYSWYQTKPKNALVPLEIIFRFGVPEGSSLLHRTSNEKYRNDIGLDKMPASGDRFAHPVLEFSTKLETTDRYVDYKEAREIAGINEEEFKTLIDFASMLSLRLKDLFQEVEIELWDGKFEFAFSGDRSFMIVDSIGPDELRLIYKGKQLSKENLRRFYRDTNWYKSICKAKELADVRQTPDWKSICLEELKVKPNELDVEVKKNFSLMYQSLANLLGKYFTDRDVFPNVPHINQLLEKI